MNQKDTQKTEINHYGQTNVTDIKSLAYKPFSVLSDASSNLINKKTEKLVTALYMVTDCMEHDDSLKAKLRQLGVELLSDMYKSSILSDDAKNPQISVSLSRIDEIISFIEIAFTMGFISSMNTEILKKEFGVLAIKLNSNQKEEKKFPFALTSEMFAVGPDATEYNYFIKDTIKDKKGTPDKMSFMNNNRIGLDSKIDNSSKKDCLCASILSNKKERNGKILSLIKDISGKSKIKEVSIKDISIAFTECSEKTIQRELTALVSKGQLKKIGAKRWSRYQIV